RPQAGWRRRRRRPGPGPVCSRASTCAESRPCFSSTNAAGWQCTRGTSILLIPSGWVDVSTSLVAPFQGKRGESEDPESVWIHPPKGNFRGNAQPELARLGGASLYYPC